MQINNLDWLLIVILNFFAYFVFRFGGISKGDSKEIIEFIGGTLILISFVWMFISKGLLSGVVLIIIFWVIVTPITEILIERIKRKIWK